VDNLRCRVCEETQDLEPLVAKDYFLGSKRKYPYSWCPACGSLSIDTIPDNLSELYKSYYSFEEPSKISSIRLQIYKYLINNSNFFSSILSSLLNKQDDLPIQSLRTVDLHSQSKILDVGCGAGSLLRLLHKIGFKDCLGIDPFLENDVTYASGLHLKKREIFDLEGQFDLIMFHHVFEHFENPKETLAHVSKILSDNGVCLIRIPNIDSYSFLKYKENWFSIHAPFHLFLPSRRGIEAMIESSGLAIKDVVGEQLIEFFFYSMGHELGVADYEDHGNRKFVERFGIKGIPPLHIKNELKDARQRLKQVKKYNLCDWVVYYLRKNDFNVDNS